MQAFWVHLADGRTGTVEGQTIYDAIEIAEKVTGSLVVKSVETDDRGPYEGKGRAIWPLPYPAAPVLWQFDHPVYGRTPTFCFQPEKCKGRGSCPRARACDD